MAWTKPKSMRVTRTKVRKVISRIEANDAFVFISHPRKGEVYINVGGTAFWASSETPITLKQSKP